LYFLLHSNYREFIKINAYVFKQGKDINSNRFLLSVIGQIIALLRHLATVLEIIHTFEKNHKKWI